MTGDIGERVALLVGLFVVPLLLLAIGHRLRRRSPGWRRAFWGGVLGHSLALLATLTAALYPPIWWTGGSVWRDAAVHWTLLFGGLLGAGLGALLPYRRGRPPASSSGSPSPLRSAPDAKPRKLASAGGRFSGGRPARGRLTRTL